MDRTPSIGLLGAPGSPAATLEAEWRAAFDHARQGFTAAGWEPSADTLRAAAALELRATEDTPRARPARAFLREVYAGRLVARLAEDGTVHLAASPEAMDLGPPTRGGGGRDRSGGTNGEAEG